MVIKIGLDDETYQALTADADRHLRPADWHAKAILRQALGLPFPYPAQPGSKRAPAQLDEGWVTVMDRLPEERP